MTANLTSQLRAALTRPGLDSSDFDLTPDFIAPKGRRLRPAAVLVCVDQSGQEPQVLLTKRSSRLKHHPGQIAFPGGKQDEADADVQATALREAHEEIGLSPDQVSVLGNLSAHETVTGFVVTPVLASINAPFTVVPEPGEVAEMFRVPLAHLLNLENYRLESRLWAGLRRHYFTVPYGPYYIWGATARMLRELAIRMEL